MRSGRPNRSVQTAYAKRQRLGTDAVLTLRDGRALSYRKFGDPAAPLLLYLGGLLSSRLEPEIFYDNRFFIVGVDRPGYGGSDFNPIQTAQTFADDIADLVSHLGRRSCAIFAFSGGVVFSLAIAACHPDLVTRVGGFAGLSPPGSVTLPECYIARFPRFVARPFGLKAQTAWRCLLYCLPAGLLRGALIINPREHRMNKRALTTPVIRTLKSSFREALRKGWAGLQFDLRLCMTDWGGFDPRHVRAPVFLFHGRDDKITPDVCTSWYERSLPHCTARYFPGETHLSVPLLHGREMFDLLARNTG